MAMFVNKRRISLFLFVVLVVFVTACSKTTDKKNESVSSPTSTTSQEGNTATNPPPLYVIKVLATPNTANITSSDQTPIGKIIKDKFNIVLEYIPYTGDYRNKLNLMLASGDYPEVLRVEQNDLVGKYIQAGVALQLDDYLKEMPNFQQRYKDAIPFWRLASSDGILYKWELNLPSTYKRSSCDCYGFLVRTDALEEAGYPKLLSTDDYIEFLSKALKNHPTTLGKKTIGLALPFAESWGMAGLVPALYQNGENIVSVGNSAVVFNVKTEKYEDMFLNPYVKESLHFFNKAYVAGLLTDESFTATLAQVTEQVNAGQVLSMYYPVVDFSAANKNLEKAGHPELEYVRSPGQTPDQVKNNEKRLIRVEDSRPFDSYIITKNAKYPDRIIQLMDWLATEEGQLLSQAGIEGVDYKVVDGKREFTQQFNDGYAKDPANYMLKQGVGMFSIFGNSSGLAKADGQNYDLRNDVDVSDNLNLTPRTKEVYNKLGWNNSLQWWFDNGVEYHAGLIVSVTIDPTSELGNLEQKLTQFRVQNSTILIRSKNDEEFNKNYEELVLQYNRLQPQRVIDEYNNKYQELASKLKK